MQFILSPSHDTFFNLALEEYLANHMTDDSSFFLLYRNMSSVVMGKNQNAWEEMNYGYLQNQNVILARRISGGGTVYHDLENLNFSFIKALDKKLVANYDTMLEPIVSYLNNFGLGASIGKRSDIWVQQRKVTGTAQYTNRKRFITHGTLLFNANLDKLEQAITPPTSISVTSKSLKSVRSKVANIKDFITEKLTIEDFEQALAAHIFKELRLPFLHYQLTPQDIQSIQELAQQKYDTFEWIWGRSPSCVITRHLHHNSKPFTVQIQLQRQAVIEAISSENIVFNNQLQKLVHQTYSLPNLKNVLTPLGFSEKEIQEWF